MKIDPVSLKLFVAVMEEGTLSDAATREHIAFSALSKRISELEGLLNIQLFSRSNKGTVPTPAAFALLGLARSVLNDLDGIATQMADYATGTRGHVRVSANISAITQFLPADIRSFTARFPQVQIHLQERISSLAAKAVAENAADIGIFNVGEYGVAVRQLPYREDELIVVVPRQHALARRKSVTMREALDYDFIGAHPGSSINNLLTKVASDLSKPLRLRMQVTSYDALCLMVSEGLGIGVMPRKSAALYLGALKIRCVTLNEPWARRQLVIGIRADGGLPAVAQLLVDHLQGGHAETAVDA